jgi:two-component system, response regulator YesN
MKDLFGPIARFLRGQKLFFFFLRSYLVLFALLLAFGLVSYTIAIRQITVNMERTNTLVLEGISDRIDARLHETERMAYRLTSLSGTSRLALVDRYDATFYYRMLAYVGDLWTLWLENDPLTPRMFVYFSRSGIVAGPTTFYRGGAFYDRFFHYADMDGDAFFAMLTDPANHDRYLPAVPVDLNDDESTTGTYDFLTYIYQMRPALGVDPPGAVFFLIDAKEMQGMLEAVELGEGGVAAIVDEEGRVLVKLDRNSGLSDSQLSDIATGGTGTIGEKMVYSSMASRNGWRYIALGSPRILMQPVVALQRSLILLLLASALVSIAVSLFQAHFRSLPLARLARLLSPERLQETAGETGYSLLETGVEDLLDDNRVLRTEMSELQSQLEPAILHRILSGAFADDAAIAEAARRIRIELPSPPYALVSFHTLRNPLHEESTAIVQSVLTRETVKDVLDRLTGCSALVHELNPLELLWIHGSPMPAGGAPLPEILDRAAALLDAQGFPVEIRMSEAFPSLSTAWWEYARLQQPAAAETGGERASQTFGRTVEPLLALAFRSQDERMLAQLFDLVEREYFQKGEIPIETRNARIAELRRMVARVTGVHATGDEAYEELRTLVLEACRSAVLSRPSPGSFLRHRILEHIQKNLFHPDLSLASIADRLHISESYLSRVFKEQTGENLSGHIERKRLAEAVRLLHDSDLTVSEIAGRTGYTSDAAFRRAFKRVHGVSPNDFRNSIPREP